MLDRRDVLKWSAKALVWGGACALPVPAHTQSADPSAPFSFSFARVLEKARTLAENAYKVPNTSLPDFFSNLAYEQYVSIRLRPEQCVWANESTGFIIEPLHRGFVFLTPMVLNIVENGIARPLTYRAEDFDFGALAVPKVMPDIGFSGFRILTTHQQTSPVEVAMFQGASFFRALGFGQNFGITSRGLTLKTADPRGEEFPIFREVWIEHPQLSQALLTLYAVLDSESVVGAYRFTFRPGEASLMDIECTLFPRVNVDHIGLGAMQATFLRSPLSKRNTDDFRPIVAESQGLRMLSGRGEWIWRPLANRDTLQISSFVDENPVGFGLLQTDRNSDHFKDEDQRWEKRPSLWVEPIGDWGPGTVSLVEIPSESEMNQNVIAYWKPNAPLLKGKEFLFAYRQFWCALPPNRPTLAIVGDSRMGGLPNVAAGGSNRKRRFLVEFSGGFLESMCPADVMPHLTVSAGTPSLIRGFLSCVRKTYRVFFDFDPGNETLSEMRLLLMGKENKPLSETWLYRWAI